jgi:hypothetical protein
VSKVRNLQAEIARARYRARCIEAPPVNWIELVEEYRADGIGAPATSKSYWIDDIGHAHSMAPLGDTRIFEALRSAMRTSRGKWLATKLVVEPTGRYRYVFDYRAASFTN